jgi:hypothetical protein
MEIKDDTEALRQAFSTINPDVDDVESIHRADLAPEHAMAFMANPKLALKAMGVPVSDESVVAITMKNRADRNATTVGTSAARIRRIIIIVIHYRNCDSDVIIIAQS